MGVPEAVRVETRSVEWRTDASDARRQPPAIDRAAGAVPNRLASLLRFLTDADRAVEPGRLDSSPIAHVHLATMEERADPVCAPAPSGRVPLPRGRRCRGRTCVLAHGSPCGGAAGAVQRLLRLARPSSLGGTADRLGIRSSPDRSSSGPCPWLPARPGPQDPIEAFHPVLEHPNDHGQESRTQGRPGQGRTRTSREGRTQGRRHPGPRPPQARQQSRVDTAVDGHR